MPYYLEIDDRQLLERLRLTNVCKECGGKLEALYDISKHLPYLQCRVNPHHEGIEREASRYEKEGLASLNILTRREIMEKEYGEATTKALSKYIGVVSLTKPQAKEILVAVFPEAPDQEITRAVMLCASYGLNPLMKHVFLIPFNKGKPNESWATVIGIKAKRLLASRRGNYSYVDNTPRIMTEEEQRQVFGETYSDKIMVITKLKDPATGAEAPGYGAWPKDTQPYGTDKGNSKFNMAAIRSESQALDRLRPGEMPVGIEVAPEEFINAQYTIKEEPSLEEQDKNRVFEPYKPEELEPKPKEHWCEKHNCAFEKKTRGGSTWYAHKLPSGSWCNEAKKKESKAEPPEESQEVPTSEQLEAEARTKASYRKQPERDPETIKTLNELMKACHTDFGLQPNDIVKELGYSTQFDIAELPSECYRKIAAVRQ